MYYARAVCDRSLKCLQRASEWLLRNDTRTRRHDGPMKNSPGIPPCEQRPRHANFANLCATVKCLGLIGRAFSIFTGLSEN